MNIFQSTYDARLQSWYSLRGQLKNLTLSEQCILVDNWWQKAPLVTHYLHQSEISTWPGPWELLVENTYCTLARGLGMCYTLYLTGITNLEMVLAKDDMNEDAVLVLVDNAKYILNYHPNTVISNTLTEFKITAKLDIEELTKKIK
jgi:hypothetical protein